MAVRVTLNQESIQPAPHSCLGADCAGDQASTVIPNHVLTVAKARVRASQIKISTDMGMVELMT